VWPSARYRGHQLAEARLRRVRTEALTQAELVATRQMLVDAFASDDDGFGTEDWLHALGGMHFVLDLDGAIVAHASVVERELRVGSMLLRTGYVEAVATAPTHQRRGLGTRVMADAGAYIADRFELGVLGTGQHGFYERLNWRTWRGPSFVRTADGEHPTPDADGYLMVLITPATPPLDFTLPISCEWRLGDVW
jgi:aminoglycoside 2'-N-acetyltransferase I